MVQIDYGARACHDGCKGMACTDDANGAFAVYKRLTQSIFALWLNETGVWGALVAGPIVPAFYMRTVYPVSHINARRIGGGQPLALRQYSSVSVGYVYGSWRGCTQSDFVLKCNV